METLSPEIIERANSWLSNKYDNTTRERVQELLNNNPNE